MHKNKSPHLYKKSVELQGILIQIPSRLKFPADEHYAEQNWDQ